MPRLSPYRNDSTTGGSPWAILIFERKKIPLFSNQGAVCLVLVERQMWAGPLPTEWRNPMIKRGRPRECEGAVYEREDSKFLHVWYRDMRAGITGNLMCQRISGWNEPARRSRLSSAAAAVCYALFCGSLRRCDAHEIRHWRHITAGVFGLDCVVICSARSDGSVIS